MPAASPCLIDRFPERARTAGLARGGIVAEQEDVPALGAAAAGGLAAVASGIETPSSADTVPVSGPDVRGTWVLQQVSSSDEVRVLETDLVDVLTHDGIVGLSIRVPWSSLEPAPDVFDFSAFAEARRVADVVGKKLAVRFMAGTHTPAWRMGRCGLVTGTSPSGRSWSSLVPLPFLFDGSPNTVFEGGWGRLVDLLSLWCLDNRVNFLHGAWWGGRWSELFLDGISAYTGYTYSAVRDAHLRLLDHMLALTSNDRACELPVSGFTGGTTIREEVTAHVIASPARDSFFIQSNHIDETTVLGSYAPPPRRGWQMLGAAGYTDWPHIYAECFGAGEYLEIYAPSFFSGDVTELYRQALLAM